MMPPLPPSGRVTIRPIQTTVRTSQLPGFDPCAWLQTQQAPYHYLLAHTIDGIIWGTRDGADWRLSCDQHHPPQPAFTQEMVLEIRLFAPEAEVYVWRGNGRFYIRTVQDNVANPTRSYEAYDEPQILWGTRGELVSTHFVRLTDGGQGLAHDVPLPGLGNFDAQNVRPVYLSVRHYVERDVATGLARVTMSRLFDLAFIPMEEQNDTSA